jgi:glycosyltransferase involved in cell wall biosynthesis
LATTPRRRVLHVAHNCLPHIGGLETVVAAETRGLAARGWDVTLLSSAGTVGSGSRDEDGVRTVRVPAWNGLEERYGVPFPVFSPAVLVATWREVRRADVVHVHDVLYLNCWVAAVLCVLLRTPYVVHRHVAFVHHPSRLVSTVQRAVLASFGRFVLARAAVVLAIDEHVADGVRSAAPATPVRVIGNGVDTELFRPASPDARRRTRRARGLPVDRPLVLFVGRFVPKKGFREVAAASSEHYDLVFVGGDRPPGLDDPRLHFLGGVPAAEMPAIYACADLMVVASVGECPLTVLESMSSGLPLVANDDPALHSPWTSGPGVTFVDVAAGGLRPALERLVADPVASAQAGSEARAHVERAFSWDTHLSRLEEVYARLLTR